MSLVDRLLTVISALNAGMNKPSTGGGIDIAGLGFVINDRVKAHEVASLREAVGWDGRLARYTEILSNPFVYAGCYDKDKLVGFCRAISDGVDDAVIFDLAVLKEYRRSGVGSGLVDKTIAYCASMGIKAVCVLFEPHLIPFYEKRGFIRLCGGVIDTELMDGPWRKELDTQ